MPQASRAQEPLYAIELTASSTVTAGSTLG